MLSLSLSIHSIKIHSLHFRFNLPNFIKNPPILQRNKGQRLLWQVTVTREDGQHSQKKQKNESKPIYYLFYLLDIHVCVWKSL